MEVDLVAGRFVLGCISFYCFIFHADFQEHLKHSAAFSRRSATAAECWVSPGLKKVFGGHRCRLSFFYGYVLLFYWYGCEKGAPCFLEMHFCRCFFSGTNLLCACVCVLKIHLFSLCVCTFFFASGVGVMVRWGSGSSHLLLLLLLLARWKSGTLRVQLLQQSGLDPPFHCPGKGTCSFACALLFRSPFCALIIFFNIL